MRRFNTLITSVLQQNRQTERNIQLISKAIETALDEATDFREALQKGFKNS
jgi:hypothetical protein